MSGCFGIIVCENFRAEVEACLDLPDKSAVVIQTYRSSCHRPKCGQAPFSTALKQLQAKCSKICILGGSCVTPWETHLNPAPRTRNQAPIHLIGCETCFQLFISRWEQDFLTRQGAYLMTPGWLARWREYIQEWQFDAPTGRAFFQESARKLVLLDTGVNPGSAFHLQEFSAYTALPSEIIPVDMRWLRASLGQALAEWQRDRDVGAAQNKFREANSRAAEYAMAFELLGGFAAHRTENDVVVMMLEAFAQLFAPTQLTMTMVKAGQIVKTMGSPAALPPSQVLQELISDANEPSGWLSGQQGFWIRLTEGQDTLGVIEVASVRHPQFLERYLNLAHRLAPVFSLVLRETRVFQKLEETNQQLAVTAAERLKFIVELNKALASVKTLSDLLPICAYCKKIRNDDGYWKQLDEFFMGHPNLRFSHGMCPDCMKIHWPDPPATSGH